MEQNVYAVITDKRSIPFNSNGTGTIETFGEAIVGSGTAFTTEMKAGSYLVSESQWEVRRVRRVDSDTLAFLDKPFTSNLTSAAPSIIPWYAASPKMIALEVKSTDPDALIDNVAFSGILNLDKTGNSRSSFRDIIKPIVVDASGTEMKVDILY